MFLIILSMIMPTVFVAGCLYYFIFTIMADSLLLPDLIARDLGPVIYRINLILVIGLPVVFVAMLTWAIILSHRFIGPLERLEEDIRKINEGDYSVRLQIQEDHDLRPIANVINNLVDKLNKQKG